MHYKLRMSVCLCTHVSLCAHTCLCMSLRRYVCACVLCVFVCVHVCHCVCVHVCVCVCAVLIMQLYNMHANTRLEITVGHWTFSDQFQHLAAQNPF